MLCLVTLMMLTQCSRQVLKICWFIFSGRPLRILIQGISALCIVFVPRSRPLSPARSFFIFPSNNATKWQPRGTVSQGYPVCILADRSILAGQRWDVLHFTSYRSQHSGLSQPNESRSSISLIGQEGYYVFSSLLMVASKVHLVREVSKRNSQPMSYSGPSWPFVRSLLNTKKQILRSNIFSHSYFYNGSQKITNTTVSAISLLMLSHQPSFR